MRIGTMIRGGIKTPAYLKRFIPTGIESVQFAFWDRIPDEIDEAWMDELLELCREADVIVSSLGLFADPFRGDEEFSWAEAGWKKVLELASSAGIPQVSGFTGRVPGRPAEESLEPIRAFFTPLIDICLGRNIRLTFENCPMGGNRKSGAWNIAFDPEYWTVLFNEHFAVDAVGLEFDPSHCPVLGQDGLALAESWLPKIYHIHGKDTLSQKPEDFCFPGRGLFDWEKLMSLLKGVGYTGTLDLEGYHGPFVSHEAEVDAQKESLEYLKGVRSALWQ